MPVLDLFLSMFLVVNEAISWLEEMENLAFVINQISGTLPEVMGMMLSLTTLFFSNTNLIGRIPEVFGRLTGLTNFVASRTLLSGTVPRSLGRLSFHYIVLAETALNPRGVLDDWLQSVGSLPRKLSLSRTEICGTILKFSGTFQMLSLAETKLQGSLPEGLVVSNRKGRRQRHSFHAPLLLLLHGNDFSCEVPFLPERRSGLFSLGLLGNKFGSRKRGDAFPQWIMDHERSQTLCVSNHGLRTLCLTVVFGMMVLYGAVIRVVSLREGLNHLRRDLDRSDRCHQWNCSALKALALLTLFAVPVLILFYNSNMFDCPSSVGRLSAPFSKSVATTYVLAVLVVCSTCAVLQFTASVRESKLQVSRATWHYVCRASVLSLAWVVTVLIISLPGALYSMVSAVPGFMGMHWFLAQLMHQTAAAIAALLSGVVLPQLASAMSRKRWVNEAMLVTVARLLTTWVVPGLATVMLDGKCLSGWSKYWQPCFKNPSPLEIQVWAGGQTVLSALTKSMVCESLPFDLHRCLPSVVDRMAQFLAMKTAVAAHLVPTAQILAMFYRIGGSPKLAITPLLVTWLEVAVLFGPQVPLLFPLICLASIGMTAHCIVARKFKASAVILTTSNIQIYSLNTSVLMSVGLVSSRSPTVGMCLGIAILLMYWIPAAVKQLLQATNMRGCGSVAASA